MEKETAFSLKPFNSQTIFGGVGTISSLNSKWCVHVEASRVIFAGLTGGEGMDQSRKSLLVACLHSA